LDQLLMVYPDLHKACFVNHLFKESN
jgi:hypothetical protein